MLVNQALAVVARETLPTDLLRQNDQLRKENQRLKKICAQYNAKKCFNCSDYYPLAELSQCDWCELYYCVGCYKLKCSDEYIVMLVTNFTVISIVNKMQALNQALALVRPSELMKENAKLKEANQRLGRHLLWCGWKQCTQCEDWYLDVDSENCDQCKQHFCSFEYGVECKGLI